MNLHAALAIHEVEALQDTATLVLSVLVVEKEVGSDVKSREQRTRKDKILEKVCQEA